MKKDKNNILTDYKAMIEKSWTYSKLTIEERNQLSSAFDGIQTREALKGTYKQRWDILNAVYRAFLLGVGYTDFSWREKML